MRRVRCKSYGSFLSAVFNTVFHPVIQSLKLCSRHIAGVRVLFKKSVASTVFVTIVLVGLVVIELSHDVFIKTIFERHKLNTRQFIPHVNSSSTNLVRHIEKVDSKLLVPYSNSTSDFNNISHLANDLRAKLALADHVTDIDNITSRCQQLGIVYPGECNATVSGERCLHAAIPDDVVTRLEHLVLNKRLQVPETYLRAIQHLTDQLDRDYEVIIVSALSSNHFNETQAMLSDLHEFVFPILKDFRLVLFDIGLKVEEREEMEKHCRCTVIIFPFDQFPKHFEEYLKCYSWKPVVVKAVYARANVVVWMDASVRFTIPKALQDIIARVKVQGVLQRRPGFNISNPYFTLPQMFEYFGDSPCAHLPFYQVESGFGVYHREPLIEQALINPWVACALNPECSCPVDPRTVKKCPHGFNPREFGHCMRNDQSSLTIILGKLFREKYLYFAVPTDGTVDIERGDRLEYFKILDGENAETKNSSIV
ncbi:uncharacterized protein LOC131933790 [Physella acuta]|uniref:uncharacterized protein LOC131933790 n=1 Tax=Physella acuta TaxID=109671 RepID=UPI0027DD4CF2|nr:uncharacterized protein LOC131933790 [Physella acuta]